MSTKDMDNIKRDSYLLTEATISANDFSHVYILIILIPVMTSFISLTLSSVKIAVFILQDRTNIVKMLSNKQIDLKYWTRSNYRE